MLAQVRMLKTRLLNSSARQVLLGDVGAGKSSLVLRFVKGQFVEFQVRFHILLHSIYVDSV